MEGLVEYLGIIGTVGAVVLFTFFLRRYGHDWVLEALTRLTVQNPAWAKYRDPVVAAGQAVKRAATPDQKAAATAQLQTARRAGAIQIQAHLMWERVPKDAADELARYAKTGRLKDILEDMARSGPLDRDLIDTAGLYRRARLLMAGHQPVWALVDAAAAAARPDAPPGAVELHARCLGIAGANSQAVAEAVRAAENGGGPEAWITASDYARLDGTCDLAVELADRAVALDPANAGAHAARADALRVASRYDEAEAEYCRAVELAPKKAHIIWGRLSERYEACRFEDAEADLRALLALDPPAPPATRIGALIMTERFAEGLAEAVRLQRAGNRVIEAGLRADCLRALGQTAAALESLEMALAERPNVGAYLDEKARLFALEGRLDEALPLAHGVAEASPNVGEFRETVGLLERWAGRPEVAIGEYDRSVASQPRNIRAVAERACCLAQLGRTKEAAAALDALPSGAARRPHVAYARAALSASDGHIAEAGAFLEAAAKVRPELAVRVRIDPVMAAVRSDKSVMARLAGYTEGSGA
jgi:tetratricopeptide (TPR) repeat protein